jgi:putative phage-type endonuclease
MMDESTDEMMDYLNEFMKSRDLKDYQMSIKFNQIQCFEWLLNLYEIEEEEEEEEDNSQKIDKLKSVFDSIVISQLQRIHIPEVLDELLRIDVIDVPLQRSPEWHAQRGNMISASDAFKASNLGTESAYNDVLFKKIGVKDGGFKMGHPLIHGTVCEIISQRMYETRNRILIKEYGCLPHPDYSYIGASPDGIVYDIEDETDINQVSLIGRMLEIKNPTSRKIFILPEEDYSQKLYEEKIKIEYWYQMQLQMNVCNLRLCDFLETSIDYYTSYSDFENDIFIIDEKTDFDTIQNKNIPLTNINSEGMEKGLLLQFVKFGGENERDSYEGIIYPIEKIYNKTEMYKWIHIETNTKLKEGFVLDRNIWWKCSCYQIKTVERNDNMLDNLLIPNLKKTWEDITTTRELSIEDIQQKFSNKLDIEEHKIEEDNETKTVQKLIKKKKNKKPTNFILMFND